MLAVPDRAIDRVLAKKSLAHFVRMAWPIVEPTTPLVWNWHLDAVCLHLQALLEGRLPKQNLIINVPPGSMKSTIVSVCAPAWVWSQDGKGRLGPSWRGIFAAGNDGLALRDSMKCRDVLDSDWYRDLFTPDWRLAADQNAKGFYKNSRTGFRKAMSAGASVTGDRGDDIFVDDPIDAKKALSKPSREEIKVWWDQAFGNRLNDLRTGHRCIIMQRLHEEDLVGHILGKEPEAWEVLRIPQEFEPRAAEDRGPTSLGWTDPRTLEGELLFPERFPESVLASERIRLGSAGYAGQHQQRPAPMSGNIFKREWFQSYQMDPFLMRGQCPRVVQSWDMASKQGQENDYSVCTTWGIRKEGYYLLDVWRGKLEFPELKRQVVALAAKWNPNSILIEDASSGVQTLQELRRETRLPLLPIPVGPDKTARAMAASPTVEAGNVFLPMAAPWVADFIEEMCLFPKGTHDDQLDTATQFINWANTAGMSVEIKVGGSRLQSGPSYLNP